MRMHKIFSALLLIGLYCSCSGPTDNKDDKLTLNPYLKQLKWYDPGLPPNYIDKGWKYFNALYAIWSSHEPKIYYDECTEKPSESGIGTISYSTQYDSTESKGLIGGQFFTQLSISSDGTKLLAVVSKYYNSSRGGLWEIDANTGSYRVILDASANVASARYLPDGVGIIYYRRNDTGINDGYYYHNLVTAMDSLILSKNQLPLYSYYLGFDVRSDGRKIIFSAEAAPQYAPPPSRIVEYDLITHTMDTLSFAAQRGTQVWLRYNHTGTKILYCSQYPGDGKYPPESKIGIVDATTQAETPLDVRTDSGPHSWVLAYNPEWSMDDTKLLFIGGEGNGEGDGPLTLWVLTKL